MDLASRLIWIFLQNLSPELQADKIQLRQFFFCQITKCSFEFLSFDKFFLLDTVKWKKSLQISWEIHWIIMFQEDAVCISIKLICIDRIWMDLQIYFSLKYPRLRNIWLVSLEKLIKMEINNSHGVHWDMKWNKPGIALLVCLWIQKIQSVMWLTLDW